MYGLYVAGIGAELQNRQLKIITNNLANVDTPGFKREIGITEARASEEIERGLDTADSRSLNNVGGGMKFPRSVTDFSVGPLKRTQIPTDMALPTPETFFLVDEGGQQRLTRSGNFQLTADGTLRTQTGASVLSADGSPIQIDPRLPWEVTNQGFIEQPGNFTSIAIVHAKPGDLVRTGANQFRSIANPTPVPEAQRELRHGYLEQSAVKPTSELMQMINASRAFEANMRMVQNHDHISTQLLQRVLAS